MTQVAILGCGPAGLLAALAVDQSGHDPVIFSKKVPSEMFGAQFLHRWIPGVNTSTPDFEIDIIKQGRMEGYAYNVYGDKQHRVSWEKFDSGRMPAWDLVGAYKRLWDLFESRIVAADLDLEAVGSICSNYSLVLSTVPAPAICSGLHEFRKQPIWIVHRDGTEAFGTDTNLMYYNGEEWDGSGPHGMVGHPWYRYSQINGYQAWEYSRPPETRPNLGEQLTEGVKVKGTECDCWVGGWTNFNRLGRFGTWKPGVLTHHAYEAALEACCAL